MLKTLINSINNGIKCIYQNKKNTMKLDSLSWALEFAQGFDWILHLLLRTLPDFSSDFFWFLRTYKRLLFRRLHLPDNDWRLKIVRNIISVVFKSMINSAGEPKLILGLFFYLYKTKSCYPRKRQS